MHARVYKSAQRVHGGMTQLTQRRDLSRLRIHLEIFPTFTRPQSFLDTGQTWMLIPTHPWLPFRRWDLQTERSILAQRLFTGGEYLCSFPLLCSVKVWTRRFDLHATKTS